MIKKLFTEHPTTVKQTYAQHAKFSFFLGYSGLKIMIAGTIHAIFPFILKKAASDAIQDCHERIRIREEEILNDRP